MRNFRSSFALAMRPRRFIIIAAVGGTLMMGLLAFATEWVSGIPWTEPKVIDPGPAGGPPSDAVVLFDGKDLSQWADPGDWHVEDGCLVGGKTYGLLSSKRAFGDCQVHVEWATPEKIEGEGQGRGNSGVFMMGHYEIQILDSCNNPTYFDGQAASIYKQRPPLVNACRKPGQWQTYDIVFEAPRFDGQGKLVRPAYVTVLQNDVLVQNHVAIQGDTFYDQPPKYTAHAAKLPLALQFHVNKVRFRNVWVRDLPPSDAPPPKK